jgi:mannose-6-phosphate isomerase-like protein (cupin superfamily)
MTPSLGNLCSIHLSYGGDAIDLPRHARGCPGHVGYAPAMANDDRYDTRLDDKYGQLNVIDIPAEVAAHQPWFNQTLTRVNDCVLRLGIIEGEYHWHKHDHEDECFVVLDGELLIDIEGKDTVTLGRHLGFTIPRGVVHRTRAKLKTVILMIEGATVTPTGDQS